MNNKPTYTEEEREILKKIDDQLRQFDEKMLKTVVGLCQMHYDQIMLKQEKE